jgi:hypothetical protein
MSRGKLEQQSTSKHYSFKLLTSTLVAASSGWIYQHLAQVI